MITRSIRVMASVVAVAILAFPAVRALPEPVTVPTAKAPAPSAEASAPAPSAENPEPASLTESPAAAPQAETPTPPLPRKPRQFSKQGSPN